MSRRFDLALSMLSFCLAVPAQAETPRRFDLMCEIHTKTSMNGAKPDENDENVRASVDFKQRLWCWHNGSACQEKLQIASISGDVLHLLKTKNPDAEIEVDLSSGAYHQMHRINMSETLKYTVTSTGHCTMAPFTPGLL